MAVDPAPLVTIYIPTRNRPDFIQRAVKSCLAQTYRPIEIIVVDDDSDAETKALLQRMMSDISELKVLFNQTRLGACQSRNKAIQCAAGEFITGLDDDDEFEPNRIDEFVRQWTSADAFLCTGYQFILTKNKTICSARQAQAISLLQLLEVNMVGNQLFTKTAYMQHIGGFDPSLIACQDYDVWIRLAMAFGGGRRLGNFSYVVHQEHELERISTVERRLLGHQQLIDKHRLVLSQRQYNSQLFFRQLQSGQHIALVPLLKLSGPHWPTLLKVWLVQCYLRMFGKR